MNVVYKIVFIYLSIIIKTNENYFKVYINNIFDIKKISIIIPVFNTEKYLSNCLNSVIEQTLKNIEIICINDGSTDNSSKILENYSKFDNRIIVINQKNKGSGYSRNKGIDISRGKFISFLDSDDMYYDKFALESLFNKAKINKAIICGGGMEKRTVVNNKTFINTTLFEHEGFIKYINYQYDYDYQRYIYSKNFLRINKLYFPRYIRYQDPPFFIKTMFTAKEFYVIKNITNVYRKNISKKFNLNQIIDIFNGIKDCLELGEKLGLYKLYKVLLSRLNMKLFLEGIKKFGHEESLKKIIFEIIRNINFSIIKKTKFNFTLDNIYKNMTYNI